MTENDDSVRQNKRTNRALKVMALACAAMFGAGSWTAAKTLLAGEYFITLGVIGTMILLGFAGILTYSTARYNEEAMPDV